MRNIVKWILIALPIAAVAGVALIVLGSYMEHKELIEEELDAFPAPGTLVSIEGSSSKLHVYTEGEREGDLTLVFLSGFGTSSPVYDFKPLYSRLSEEYRIAVVERSGYGWSSESDSPRDIDTVLAETRAALAGAGESPPYVIFPHSMAGLESIYWASQYPEEVSAIIGLDALIPEYYEHSQEDPALSTVITVLARTGLMRNQPGVCKENIPAVIHGHLTDEEAEIACTIFFRRTNTKNMHDEAEMLSENVHVVSGEQNIDVPFHGIISSEAEELWKQSLSAFSKATGGHSVIVDGGHYIHHYAPEFIAETSRELIRQLKQQ